MTRTYREGVSLGIVTCFFHLSGLLLLITGLAKLVSGFSGDRVMVTFDPVFSIQYRYLFLFVGIIEMLVAFFCFLSKEEALRAILVASLATNFVAYRLALSWLGYLRPCGCLGNLTDALQISPQAADRAMKVLLVYLLIGSYSTLLWQWKCGVKKA